MTVSQYDHVVPHTDLSGRGYLGVYRRSCYEKYAGYQSLKLILVYFFLEHVYSQPA